MAMRTLLAISAGVATGAPPADPAKVVYKMSLRVDQGPGAGCTEASAMAYADGFMRELDRAAGASSFTLDPSPKDADLGCPSDGRPPRRVHFLDTDDAALHKGGYILRWRWDLDGSADPYGTASDFTFKRRSPDVPSADTWAALALSDAAQDAQVRWKVQHTNKYVDPPLYGVYAGYKSKHETVTELQAALGGANFSSATVAEWERAFPALGDYASVSSSAGVSPHGLAIYEYEVLVGDADRKFRFTLSRGGAEVSHKLEPSIILWCDQDGGAEAFTGEFTWTLDYKDRASGFDDFFSELLQDGLGGFAGGSPKTCMAYDKMGLIPCDNSLENAFIV